ncbi:MAG: hypothetical protein ACRD1X_15025, partial [Vicinamibacteria bacterium]
SPLLSPKQVVRNVESALAAGLGIVIDRRIVSVAQIRRDALEPLALDGETGDGVAVVPVTSGDGSEREAVRHEQRIIFLGWDARNHPNVQAECRVTVRRDGREVTGSGSGAASPQGRALAAARALFAALADARGHHDLVLEDAKIVETHGRSYVLVAARALTGRQSRPLTGVAPLEHSPEEAAILASLQATNRWTGKED